jgi:hypothetical protein
MNEKKGEQKKETSENEEIEKKETSENEEIEKKETSKEDKESELEEEVTEEEQEIKTNKFKEFFSHPVATPIIEESSPSLEKINIAPKVPIRLEQGLASSSTSKKDEEVIKYGAELYKKEEPKYQSEDAPAISPERIQMENLERERPSPIQKIGLIQSNEIPKVQEDYIPFESRRTEDFRKSENPFGPKTIKYKPPE